MNKRLGKGKQGQFQRLILVTALACAMSDMAMAQTTAVQKTAAVAATKTAVPEVLDEIIVTAEKREVSIQKTSISMTALNTGELEKKQVTNLMNLANIAPSVNIVPFTANKASPNLFIRGMGGTDTQSTKDNATGIYVDGVPIGRGNALGADIADLERIEILRGPQGTLYGRNTTAGAINFITRKPDKDFSFEQELGAGSYDLFSSRTRVNIPLSENIFTRFSYTRSSNDGWVRNTNNTLPDQTNFNKDRKEALKWAFRWRATDNLLVDYGVDSSKLTYGNLFYQIVAGATAVGGRQEETNAPKGLSPSNANVLGHNLALTWDFGGIVLKSLTSYRKMDATMNQYYINVFNQLGIVNQDQTSQEFQIVGDTLDKQIKYVAGVFYYKEDSDEQTLSTYSPTLTDFWKVKAASKSTAVYGQATWKPAALDDRLGLTLGLRDTQDTRDATKTFVSSGFLPTANGTVVPGHKNFSKISPSFTADYAFSNTINGYAKVGTGYRAGGFNTRSTVAGFGQGFNQETVRNVELGLKSDLLDRRLRVNVAAFQADYSNLIVDQVRTPAIFTDTLNAGKARVKGLELEAKALLTKGLSANLFYSYLDGKFLSYIDNGVDLASVKFMPLTPKGQGGVGLEYSPGVTTLGNLTFNLDYKWQDQWYSGPNPNTLTDGYHVWNARVQLADIRVVKGAVRVAAWVKNLTDEKYRVATTNLGILAAQFGEPRTVGLNLIYEYY